MSGWYVVESTVILSIGLLVYRGFLSRETFHRSNRATLLFIVLASCVLPFVEMSKPGWLENSRFLQAKQWVIETSASPGELTVQPERKDGQLSVIPEKTDRVGRASWTGTANVEWISILIWVVYLIGLTVMLVRFAVQMGSIGRRIYRNGHEKGIIRLNYDISPHSFFNFIFIGSKSLEPGLEEHVLLHERIHVMQGHSMDRLVAELVVIFHWFNPLAWLFRREVALNLEYLTDHTVMKSKSVDPAEYQMNLLKVAAPGSRSFLLAHYSSSDIKKRIAMINKKVSDPRGSWKYVLLIPAMLLADLMASPARPLTDHNFTKVDNPATGGCAEKHFTVLFHAGSSKEAIDRMISQMAADGIRLRINELVWDPAEEDLLKELSAQLCCDKDCVAQASLRVQYNLFNQGGLSAFWSNGRGYGATTDNNTWDAGSLGELMEDLLTDDAKVYTSFGPSGLSKAEFLSSDPFADFNRRFEHNRELLRTFRSDQAVVFPDQPTYEYFVNDRVVSPGLLRDLFSKSEILQIRFVEKSQGKSQVHFLTSPKPLSEEFLSHTFRMSADHQESNREFLLKKIDEYDIDIKHQFIYIEGMETNEDIDMLKLEDFRSMSVNFHRNFTREGLYSHISMHLFLE